jgi:uncharacterized protein (DUF488 family)
MKLATIGYEMAPQAAVIAALKAAGVEVLIDVRAVAASRRAGFSKGLLSSSLSAAGVEYVHLRELGTPKPGRMAARAGRTAEMREIFSAHMEEPSAQLQLAQAIEIAKGRPTALLCFCDQHSKCHRAIVADRMAEAAGFEIEILTPSAPG